jgi:hypothetical protein
MLLSIPALWGGLSGDDYIHRYKLLGLPSIGTETNIYLDLFRFFPGDPEGTQDLADIGFLPWWRHPEIRAAFLRPVTAATHVLDYTFWPDNVILQHLHSLLWYALAVGAITLVYRKLFPSAVTAGLASLMFLAEDAHALPAGWLANRNALLALVFGGLALLLHIRWRRDGRRRELILALLSLGVGLICSESALGALAYIVAYELTLERGPWLRRMGALLPYGVLVLAWRAIHIALGFGARGSGLYVDPAREPLDFAIAVFERGPILFLSQWAQISVDFYIALPRYLQIGLTVSGIAVAVAVVLLFYRLLRDIPVARFWGLGLVLALIPQCAAFPMTRLLIFVGVGAFGLLATQVENLGWLDGPPVERRGRLVRAGTGLLLALHLALAIPAKPVFVALIAPALDILEGNAASAPSDETVAEQSVVFVNSNEFLAIYLPVIRFVEGGVAPKRIAQLFPMLASPTLTRVGERTINLRSEKGFLNRDFETLCRSPALPFEVGDCIETKDFVVRVTEVTSEGRPSAASFQFHLPLDDDSLRWLYWKDGALREFRLPEVGESVVVEATLPWRAPSWIDRLILGSLKD